MARDPQKTARNKIIEEITEELKELFPTVQQETGWTLETLHAKLGNKDDVFFDLKNDIFTSDDQFVTMWFDQLEKWADLSYYQCRPLFEKIQSSKAFKKYTVLFTKRTFLRNFEQLSRKRPTVEESSMWLGSNDNIYGLFVVPRFVDGLVHQKWENDKSDIRKAKFSYWTIGHVLKTGLVTPPMGKAESLSRIKFAAIEDYLSFFLNSMVRQNKSLYETAIAESYCNYVLSLGKTEAKETPLLIPQFRYAGLNKEHKHRLDFMTINPYNLEKVGYELSPWSTHGEIKGTKDLKQYQINKIGEDNHEAEIQKIKDFFMEYRITALVFTQELSDCQRIFDTYIKPNLRPKKPEQKISFIAKHKYAI
ncbi:MAG: hypothetical protein DELT_00483 [Desulfovibrio sp.]